MILHFEETQIQYRHLPYVPYGGKHRAVWRVWGNCHVEPLLRAIVADCFQWHASE